MSDFSSMEEFLRELWRVQELQDRHEETHDEFILEAEIDIWQRILPHPFLRQTPQDTQALVHSQAGQSFFYRYETQKRLEDLEMAIRLFREALQLVTDAFLRVVILHSLGDVLKKLYEHIGKLEDLKQSIAYYRDAVDQSDAIDQSDPETANMPVAFLDDLGTALRDYYTHTWDLSKLDESIKTLRKASRLALASTPEPSRYFNHLGNALIDRYHALRKLEDIQEAVRAFEQARSYCPLDDPTLPSYLSNLGNALFDRGLHLNANDDLKRALEFQRKAVKLAAEELYPRTNLAAELGYLYDRTGETKTIEESIAIFEKIIKDTLADSPDLPDYHVNLGTSFQRRYERQAQPEDVQRAIDHYQTALALISTPSNEQAGLHAIRHAQEERRPLVLDASAHPAYLSVLANAFLASYGTTGRVADLCQAINLEREALQLLPTNATAMQAEYRNGLGNLLVRLHDRTPETGPLNEAIELLQYGPRHPEAVSPSLARFYNDLGAALRQRYLSTHNPKDKQDAIAACHKALALLPPDSPELSSAYTGLGNILRNSYEHTHNVQDLDDAIQAYRDAIRTNKEEMLANIVIFHSNLSTMLFERYDVFGRSEDMEEARKGCEKACQEGMRLKLKPEVVRGTARPWGNKEGYMGNWAIAVRAYDYAVRAQESLYQVQLLQSEKEGFLSEENEIYARAAYVLARVGKLREAVTTLEQGRAKRLGEALARDHADMERIQQRDPQAFALYQNAARELRQLEMIERQNSPTTSRRENRQGRAPVVSYEEINRVRARLEQAIKRIRQLPDFKVFLAELPFEGIAASATPTHPLAYLVITPWGSLILIVRHNSQEPEPLFIDNFTDEKLRALFALKLQTGLLKLGEQLIGPLAHRLQAIGASGITLIPVGLLGVLPLHAASYQQADRTVALLDEFDVTYTPSVRVLNIAQREAQRRKKEQMHLLAIGDPRIGGQNAPPSLIYAQAEVEHIIGLLPPDTATALYSEKATLEAFWQNIPQATIAHFACHGDFDPIHPMNAKLYLAHRKILTLKALLDAKPELLARLRMAVLSACRSAQIDPEHLPDEVIGLPAGFLQAGVPMVVGTLWSVNDRSTELLMGRFYELFLRGDPQNGLAPQPPARALRLAQCWLRDLTKDTLHSYIASRQLELVLPIEQEIPSPGQEKQRLLLTTGLRSSIWVCHRKMNRRRNEERQQSSYGGKDVSTCAWSISVVCTVDRHQSLCARQQVSEPERMCARYYSGRSIPEKYLALAGYTDFQTPHIQKHTGTCRNSPAVANLRTYGYLFPYNN
jgi:CHAT domain-containing protein